MASNDPSNNPLVRIVTESVSGHHPDVPKDEVQEMAEAALHKTEDAPVQTHRAQLAEKEVAERITESGPAATEVPTD
jgi:hypothetical protein